ncbi:MarR family transcriptional regulator [Eubacteriaceae bacterium ES2]|nr:MarR family transcriptional regulator [Eubacteriaceae bacterium ES2]
MSKEELVRDCFSQFQRILNSYGEIEKEARDFGTGDRLYPSEIHALEALNKNSGQSISELARTLGITRGAVQKLSVKLEEKGYLRRTASVIDSRTICLELTEQGQSAGHGHRTFHKKMMAEVMAAINLFDESELNKTINVFDVIEKYFDLQIKEAKSENSGL